MKLLKPHLIAFISIVLVCCSKEIADSCGWWPMPEDYRFSVFQPSLAGNPELRPLIFTTDMFFSDYSNGLLYDSVYQRNIDEWQKYTSKEISKKDIYAIMYETNPFSYIDSVEWFEKENPFIAWLKQHDKEAYDYINYAKECEIVVDYPDPWNVDNTGYTDKASTDKDADIRLINEGEEKYKHSHNEFIKLHIAYQLERLLFYTGGDIPWVDTKEDIYKNKICKSKINSWIKNSAYYYAVLSPFYEKHGGFNSREEYDYILSKAFDKCIDKRFRCVQLFERHGLDTTLRLAKNNHERAILITMYELQNPGKSLNAIENIYSLDPNSKYISFLLLRELNKLEDWVVTPTLINLGAAGYENRPDISIDGYDAIDRATAIRAQRLKDLNYLDKVLDFTKSYSENENSENGLNPLMLAYLYLLKGDVNNASISLKNIESTANSAGVKNQIMVMKIMLGVIKNPAIDSATQGLIMKLCKKSEKKGAETSELKKMKEQTMLFVGKQLLKNGQVPKGILILNRTDRLLGMNLEIGFDLDSYQILLENAVPKDYDDLVNLMDKKDKSKFEKFLVDAKLLPYYGYNTYNDSTSDTIPVPFSKDRVLDYKATWYMDHDSLEQALSALRQIPDKFWSHAPYNLIAKDDPFNLDWNDMHNYEKKDKVRWNKRTFVEHLIALKKEAESNPAKSTEIYMQIANAYLSMTYYGKYWLICKTWWSGEELDDWQRSMKKSDFNDFYFGCVRAKKYYLLAAQHTKDFEIVSQCYYLAGMCDLNYKNYEWLSSHSDRRYGPNIPHFKNRYLATIKELYPHIQKHMDKRLPTECTYYEDFLANAEKN